jgi:hypothetical protein
MTTLVLLMTDPDRQGRKIHPNSLKALAQSRRGRSTLPADQARQSHTFSLRNDSWNALVSLAQSVNLSVSGLAEFFGENTDLLLGTLAQLNNEAVLERWELHSLEQWTVLPLIQVLLRYHGRIGAKRKSPRKQKGLNRPDNADKATHALTLSTAGWEGLNLLADRAGLFASGWLELVAANVDLLQMSQQDLSRPAMLEQIGLIENQLKDLSILELMQRLST